MFDFKKLFPKANPAVQVEAVRPMVVKIADGTTRTVEPGDRFEVLPDDIGGFEPGDLRVLARPSEPIMEDPTPKRPATLPPPERWKPLAQCFADWWDINERFRVGKQHLELLRTARIEFFGTDADLGRTQGAGKALVHRWNENADQANHNVVVTNYVHDLDDPKFRKISQFHHNALIAAEDHLEELRSTFGLKIQRLHLECGNCRMKSAAALTEVTTELRQTGIDLFSLRLAPLELHPSKILQLYAGSAICQKYAFHHDPSVSGTCFGGYDESGSLRIYVDDGVPAIAGGMLSDLERTAELEPLLAAGRKELAKAQKVSQAA